jgi:sugar lactone lactonase YvrE
MHGAACGLRSGRLTLVAASAGAGEARVSFTELKLFRPVLYPNGITLAADNRLLYVADILGVVRVDLQTHESVDVDPGPRDKLS